MWEVKGVDEDIMDGMNIMDIKDVRW